jgi:hypothetical protein
MKCRVDDSPLQVALKFQNLIALPVEVKYGLGTMLLVALWLEAAVDLGIRNVLFLRVGGRNLSLLLISVALAAWVWVGH